MLVAGSLPVSMRLRLFACSFRTWQVSWRGRPPGARIRAPVMGEDSENNLIQGKLGDFES
jgi:hypothetical protein